MTYWILFTTATHDDARGPFADFAEAQSAMRHEARYYRARNAYIAEGDEPRDARDNDGLEFANDYSEEILVAAAAEANFEEET
jgi:hypothetical protein